LLTQAGGTLVEFFGKTFWIIPNAIENEEEKIMNKTTFFNNPAMYMHIPCEDLNMPLPAKPAFTIYPNERIVHTFQCYDGTSLCELVKYIDDVDAAIIEEIGRSKYLTSLQIYQLVRLRGYFIKRPCLRKKILRLMKYRLIQENEILRDGSEKGLKHYELDVKGYGFVKYRGVPFHMGNRYLSYSRKIELGILDSVCDVKRVLTGNQIVIGMLMNNAKLQRFGIMETFCVENPDRIKSGCIIRTAANIKIDDGSVLAYEVVRDTAENYSRILDKVERYYSLLDEQEYLDSNHHGDVAFPQLVICGESLAHNKRIASFLIKQGLWRVKDPILFTEDLLNIKDSLNSLYEIRGEEIAWYHIPCREPELMFAVYSA